jgi:uncharacterized protein (UPF0216 family)
LANGCEIDVETSQRLAGNAIRIVNKQGSHVYLDLNDNNKLVAHFTLYHVCATLKIPIPIECQDVEEFSKKIKNNYHLSE